MMKSDDIKIILKNYLYTESRYELAIDECCFADVFAKTRRKFNKYEEFEIKTTVSDFKADFKKPKHDYYRKFMRYRGILPSYFYYVVDYKLYEKVKDLELPNEAYGIMVLTKGLFFDVRRAPKSLGKHSVDCDTAIFHRMRNKLMAENDKYYKARRHDYLDYMLYRDCKITIAKD